jgi:hypothetical protein
MPELSPIDRDCAAPSEPESFAPDQGTMTEQDGGSLCVAMARFVLVLKPSAPLEARGLIASLDPLIERLQADVDHRTPAHLSALLGGSDNLRTQLFADVQSKLGGLVLEVVVMSREAMGGGAPVTRERFQRLIDVARETMPHLTPMFRSDLDGAISAGA